MEDYIRAVLTYVFSYTLPFITLVETFVLHDRTQTNEIVFISERFFIPLCLVKFVQLKILESEVSTRIDFKYTDSHMDKSDIERGSVLLRQKECKGFRMITTKRPYTFGYL